MYTALLTAIVTWISANFDLPPDYNYPSIKLVPATQITFTPAQREILSLQTEAGQPSSRREVVSVYDDATKTIFLPDTWKGETAKELSVLAHEMVHHLQNIAGKKYNCAGAREKLAYAAQDLAATSQPSFRLMRLHST